MAHNLAMINGEVAMAYQGETPWHKLGQRLGSLRSVSEAMRVAKLDWTVKLEDMFYANLAGEMLKSEFRKSVIRECDGVELGTVTPKYHVIQNVDAFSIIQDAVENHGCTIESAGALGRGERVWMLMKLPTTIEPVPGDVINGYFLVTMAHDGTGSLIGRPTPIRVVCQNTLNAATASGVDVVRIMHRASAAQRVAEAAKLITSMVKAMKETETTFAQMAQRRMNKTDVVTFVESVFPNPDPKVDLPDALKKRRATVAQLVWTGQGAALAGSDDTGTTAWACYNAVTEYFDHVRPAEAKAASAKLSANESALFGANAEIKLLALKQARKLVAA